MSDSVRPDAPPEDDDTEEMEIEVLPVTRWDLGSVSREYIVFRPHVLTGPDQDEDAAEATNYYALTPLQVRELAEQLLDLLHDVGDEEGDDDGEDEDERVDQGPRQ